MKSPGFPALVLRLCAACLLPMAVLGAACAAEQALSLRETAVTLATPAGPLYGTELAPEAGGRVPVALLLPDTELLDRDGVDDAAATIKPLQQLAEALSRRGVATLRYDQRGTGMSPAARDAPPSGAGQKLSVAEQRAADAALWIARLHADRRYTRVIVIGHGGGALVAMLAARQARADALAAVAPPEHAPDHDLHRVMATLAMPVLVVQGKAEGAAAVDAAKSLTAANRSASLALISGMQNALPTADTGNAALSELVGAIASFAKAAPPQ